MALGMYYQKAILTSLTKRASPGVGSPIQSPTNLYISMHTANPTALHTTALANELTTAAASGYQRFQMPTDASIGSIVTFSAVIDEDAEGRPVPPDDGIQMGVHNSQNMEVAYASSDWPAFSFFGIWSVATAGAAADYLFFGQLPALVDLPAGGTLVIQGALGPEYGKFRFGVR